MAQTKILVTGATGYVGGSVLEHLRSSSNPKIKDASITTLVRRQDHADLLGKRGVKAQVFNGLDDSDQLRSIASDFDIVVHCATGSHTASAEALILGLGDAKARTGQQTYYIHTTGTSNFAQGLSNPDATVQSISDKDDVYGEEVKLEAKSPYAQRTTDLVVVHTAEKTGVKAYLLMPPTIYGKGLGRFKTLSYQVPIVVRNAIAAGHPTYIGDGSGSLGKVHIDDVVTQYEIILSKVLDGEEIPSGRKGIYFSSTGSYTWKDVNELVGQVGARLNALESSAPVSVSLEEAVEKWPHGANATFVERNFAARHPAVTKPELAFDLGWKPTRTEEKDWIADIEQNWEAILSEQKEQLQFRIRTT
ncbi:NAD dependent epimerase/dehydratase family protein [Sodiomyces alkalinus F11]|uniref:NAD dependent epimerase/dehydratase family protein n=1 Tax=Sodiomyces alkalinus (strain CBS 110278 / VKM F-3762 / F11) TaxID=1314773 RepID=A0A3N2Q5R4_SODAK|nr:NAD dependent epimerase/dehydratase family protein [Sodiomyces alkalinus F11]ROT41998.1 NAD dependent epimerase/dehydratase family protein [Sodiomyces alkalinus F11]